VERGALAIYLNDHFAGATFGVALARRSLENNRDNEFGEFLRRLAEEVDADRQSLRSMLAELGVRVDRAKQAAAWASEKLGRLKPNGQLTGYSPLSRLVELELLELGITGKLALWGVLQSVLDEPPASGDLDVLIERAHRQRLEVDQYRLRAAEDALRASIPSPGYP
jgi:hypothetical protein